ncbi:uncharacterized protein LOC108665767 [Hyalella azteca]|uniref:Carbohydrate sulfotransferase n=1 Tax=Hyalella azteca TaxID=294128 RepID=A0A8B7N2H8_HYAAZ|nr:uncharacterized protein LOC108665767 [Hyalella azteca]
MFCHKRRLRWNLLHGKRLVWRLACLLLLLLGIVWISDQTNLNVDLENDITSDAYADSLPDGDGDKFEFGSLENDRRVVENLNDVQFVFSNLLCFNSYENIPRNPEREAWIRETYAELDELASYEKLLSQPPDSNYVENIPRDNSATEDPEFAYVRERTANATVVPPSGPSLVPNYHAALAFAVARVRASPDGPVTACNFPDFTDEESGHIWHLALRRLVLDGACARHASFAGRTRAPWDCVYWDTATHLGYCALFKVGSTSWMSHMVEWQSVDTHSLTDGQVHDAMDLLYPRPPAHRLAQELVRHDLLLFMVHRHPYVRIVSAYYNKVETGYRPISRLKWIASVRGKSLHTIMEETKQAIKEHNLSLDSYAALDQLLTVRGDPSKSADFEMNGDPNNTNPYMTFQEFVRYIIKENLSCFRDVACLRRIDEHWQPQHVQCSPCSTHYDVISAMHTFDRDTSLMMKLVGREDYYAKAVQRRGSRFQDAGDQNYTTDDLTVDKKRRNVGLGEKYFTKTIKELSTLTREEQRLLYVANFLDFTLFGYSPETIE